MQVRQLTAGMLLFLFLQVLAFKFFHSHQLIESTRQSKGQVFSAESGPTSAFEYCAICDYQLTKDIDGVQRAPVIAACPEYANEPSFYIQHFLLTFHSTPSGRGPPTT